MNDDKVAYINPALKTLLVSSVSEEMDRLVQALDEIKALMSSHGADPKLKKEAEYLLDEIKSRAMRAQNIANGKMISRRA